MNVDLKFYFSLFLRRVHYFLVIALAVSGVGLTIAYTLPPEYRAEARLLVESPQIPDELAVSTVRAGMPEILQIIRQRLLTRASLLELANDFDIYKNRPEMNPDAIVGDMRSRISFSMPNRRREAASFVNVSFTAKSGRQSSEVTNELVTRILQENVALRTAVTGQTLEFFEQEVERLDREMAYQGSQILEFKLQHQNELPDSLDYRRNRQASLQERALQMERELSSLRDRRSRMVDLYEQTGRTDVAGSNLSPEEKRLAALKNQLASALVLYSEQNPKVRTLKAQVEALEAQVLARRNASVAGDENLNAFELQLADLDGQMAYIAEQKRLVEDELQTLASSIEATPKHAVALGSLQRDYDNLRTQYTRATSDLAAARTGDQIEAQSRGQRISVIEQATVPRRPSAPNRKKIAAASVVAGVMLGLGFIALLEFLNSSIRRPVDISNNLGIAPFATVPYIRTTRQLYLRRTVIIAILLIVAVGLPLVLYLLHVFYLPMDLLVEKVLNKTGISGMLGKLR